jgi:hypothetical protein
MADQPLSGAPPSTKASLAETTTTAGANDAAKPALKTGSLRKRLNSKHKEAQQVTIQEPKEKEKERIPEIQNAPIDKKRVQEASKRVLSKSATKLKQTVGKPKSNLQTMSNQGYDLLKRNAVSLAVAVAAGAIIYLNNMAPATAINLPL